MSALAGQRSAPGMAALRERSLQLAGLAICGGLLLLAAGAVAGKPTVPAVMVLGLVVTIVAVNFVKNWPRLVVFLAAVDLLIPEDGRYTFAGHIGFQLEPYRMVVGLMLIGWLLTLLADPRQRRRGTKFDAPIALILFAALGSDVINARRVETVSSSVVKGMWLFASLMLLLYLTVNVIRTRAQADRVVAALVYCGSAVGFAAVVERQLHYNVFDHLHRVLPFLSYATSATLTALMRGGNARAVASAGHPIELSNEMAMLLPLAIYLAIRRRQRRWWVAIAALLGGDLATGSRTGVLGLVVMLIVFLCLRRRETLRCWPALIPIVVVAHVLVPGSLGGIWEGFFPKGGLLAQQSQTFTGAGGQTVLASRGSRWGPELQAFAAQGDPWFGQGYATRVVGRTSLSGTGPTTRYAAAAAGGAVTMGTGHDNAIVLDDQWLDTLLETGVLGVAGWMWLLGSVVRKLGRRAKVERGTPEGWLPVAIAAATASFTVSVFTYDAFGFVQAMVVLYLLIAIGSVILSLPPNTRSGLAATSRTESA
jgi:polysaccharide biosynthesis protein PslJ